MRILLLRIYMYIYTSMYIRIHRYSTRSLKTHHAQSIMVINVQVDIFPLQHTILSFPSESQVAANHNLYVPAN